MYLVEHPNPVLIQAMKAVIGDFPYVDARLRQLHQETVKAFLEETECRSTDLQEHTSYLSEESDHLHSMEDKVDAKSKLNFTLGEDNIGK